MTNARVMQVATSLNSALANYDNRSVTATKYYNKTEIDDSNTYSTEEVDTGMTWINGKKLYRKVIESSSFRTDWGYNSLSLIPPNADFAMKEFAFSKRVRGDTVGEFYMSGGDNFQVLLTNDYGSSKFALLINSTLSVSSVTVSILYTKE